MLEDEDVSTGSVVATAELAVSASSWLELTDEARKGEERGSVGRLCNIQIQQQGQTNYETIEMITIEIV